LSYYIADVIESFMCNKLKYVRDELNYLSPTEGSNELAALVGRNSGDVSLLSSPCFFVP